ncbi:hypothetical protein KIL84_004319 [Mauremys mutica]|uniref:Uncharacterized protein n=1 Tax=Mauremys mutica TaxID=74926 RepID=A0A9D3XMR3_9SAUR|nr:hypothetical protein KIL84_004319 [Mauremys mutica]
MKKQQAALKNKYIYCLMNFCRIVVVFIIKEAFSLLSRTNNTRDLCTFQFYPPLSYSFKDPCRCITEKKALAVNLYLIWGSVQFFSVPAWNVDAPEMLMEVEYSTVLDWKDGLFLFV